MMMKNAWLLLKETFLEWHQDNVLLLAGALSFFTVFSIVPVLILMIALTGQILGEQQVQAEIIRQTTLLFNPQVASAIKAILGSASKSGAGLASIFSGLILMYIGSRVFHQLHNALGIIWKVRAHRKSLMKTTIRGHLLSFAMMAGIAVLFILFFVMDASLQTMHQVVLRYLPHLKGILTWKTISYLMSVSLFTLFCALFYRYAPRAGVHWKDVWMGAIVAGVLFLVGRSLFTLYFKLSDFASIYGVAGSVIMILFWIYLAANIFLFGAEFTWVYANHFGSRVEPKNK